jgi:dGTPase
LASSGDDSERKRFFDEVFLRLGDDLDYRRWELEQAFTNLVTWMPFDQNYLGTRDHRARTRYTTANLIARYIEAVSLQAPSRPSERRIKIEPEREKEVFMLKQLTWHYVILNPFLGAQQYGQKKIIRELFTIFQEAAATPRHEDRRIFPFAFREELELAGGASRHMTRIICDFIASMTEKQAYALYGKLTGVNPGSSLR